MKTGISLNLFSIIRKKAIICKLFIFLFLLGGHLVCFPGTGSLAAQEGASSVYVSAFDVDATPPVGSLLTYGPMINSWDLSLRARGVVIRGSDDPIVLCVVDWIGIANGGQDAFKQALAHAAGTTPERVAVHTLHQHDAPICDFSAEQILRDANIDPGCFEGSFARGLIHKLAQSVKESMLHARAVSHISFGEAPVYKVASNRRMLTPEGKVFAMRGSSCKDSLMRAQPEGLIDPMVSVIGFWDGETPVAVLSFYATHPQSYYLTQVPNPDFPGTARFLRQLEVPDAMHVHFNGAGGNIAAGKYNDGSKENRGILAQRLADGMKRAWENSERVEISPNQLNWEAYPVTLPPASTLDEIETKMHEKDLPFNYLPNYMGKLAWYKRTQAGHKIDLGCLSLGKGRILFMPGELFIEYQLAAKKMKPDLFVAMAAYGDYGPLYIGTKEAYQQEGYEIQTSSVTPEVEDVLLNGIRKLLKVSE
ncbi:hypothetical protein [Maribellus luteus]|uniref:hypothetical protein n=1 Tax=Maribellus luteus TaxID=2305463 RepID=UPI0019D490EF|nr:hypothetical protein [Maribellus luteus]